jgi:hypothetical protein
MTALVTQRGAIHAEWPPTVARITGWEPLELVARQLGTTEAWCVRNLPLGAVCLAGWLSPSAIAVLHTRRPS